MCAPWTSARNSWAANWRRPSWWLPPAAKLCSIRKANWQPSGERPRPRPRWSSAAVPASRSSELRRATDAGAQALCLSAGWRGEKPAPPVDWTLVARVREWTPAPLWIKGILAPGEARTAVEKGARGIIVSNYGGRLVDGAMAAIEALPAVVEAVGRHVPVLIDSGFRRGTDVLKALALGANGVMLGRPPLWGLAAYGAEGVQKVLELIQTELALAMGLCGKPNLAAIDRSLVKIHKR